MTKRPNRTAPAILAALMLAAALTGCSGNSSDTTKVADQSSADPALRAKLPAPVRAHNELKIATSIYAPVDFYEKDGKTLTGFDHDLMEQAAQRLGVTIKWSVIDFAAIMPGIQSGQYDFATDLNDTVDREKTVDFVSEFRDGTSILVKAGNPDGVQDLASLCGKNVVVTKGSTQIALIAKQNQSCSSPIRKLEVPDDPEAMLTMRNGRADAYLVNTLAGSYAVNSGGQSGFEVLGGVYDDVFAGLAFPKDAVELRDAMQAAINALIDDGSYEKIMKKYGLTNNMIEHSDVNAASNS